MNDGEFGRYALEPLAKILQRQSVVPQLQLTNSGLTALLIPQTANLIGERDP